MESKNRKKINIALQGGGAHGAFTWGVVDRLLQDDRIEIDSISATSAGSVNAIVIAQGLIDGGREGAREALFKFWRSLSELGKFLSPVQMTQLESFFQIGAEHTYSYFLLNLVTKLFSPYQFNPLNYNPLKEILEQAIDFEKIRNTELVKLYICATNVKSGKVKIFDNKEMCMDAILASGCLPFLFQAVEINGESYWDGGYMGNPAIFPLIYNSEINDILIIHVNPVVRDQIPVSANDIINRINEISFNSSLIRELRAISFVTKMLDDGWIKDECLQHLKKVNIHSVRADKIMEKFSVASKLYVDWVFLQELFEIGQNVAKAWLDENFSKIGIKSSMDFSEYL